MWQHLPYPPARPRRQLDLLFGDAEEENRTYPSTPGALTQKNKDKRRLTKALILSLSSVRMVREWLPPPDLDDQQSLIGQCSRNAPA
ncbi:UNVERIFIED_CONTAM: hypothetical protein K2H54_072049 [Gekko kuhli]